VKSEVFEAYLGKTGGLGVGLGREAGGRGGGRYDAKGKRDRGTTPEGKKEMGKRGRSQVGNKLQQLRKWAKETVG